MPLGVAGAEAALRQDLVDGREVGPPMGHLPLRPLQNVTDHRF